MCDADTNKDSEDYIRKISRREFGAVTAATSLAMILPPTANARMIASSEVLKKLRMASVTRYLFTLSKKKALLS